MEDSIVESANLLAETLSEETGETITGEDIIEEMQSMTLSQEDEELLESVIANEHVEIPVNSPSISVKENTSRFSGAIWYDKIQEQEVTLAGVGGIGSFCGFLLARINPRTITIYDDDIVEAANMSGQLYCTQGIGIKKVDALSRILGDFADYRRILAIPERFDSNSTPTDIMICGFDNMKARKTFYEAWKFHLTEANRDKSLFIDGRIKC